MIVEEREELNKRKYTNEIENKREREKKCDSGESKERNGRREKRMQNTREKEKIRGNGKRTVIEEK